MTYDTWKATNPADNELGSAPQGRRRPDRTDDEHTAILAGREFNSLPFRHPARQKLDAARIGRIEFKSTGTVRSK